MYNEDRQRTKAKFRENNKMIIYFISIIPIPHNIYPNRPKYEQKSNKKPNDQIASSPLLPSPPQTSMLQSLTI